MMADRSKSVGVNWWHHECKGNRSHHRKAQLNRDRFGVRGGATGWRDDGCVARLNGGGGGRLGRRGEEGWWRSVIHKHKVDHL
ncbi:hypothetical protein L195_g031405 [Trifolium pratense]|uniref:Uncharacterized protein n=1 Tax=Trifolium pratense TaxID=57577 RepID=A0A2K3LAA9_TRIPR|nr:hypothetical protein L195_g031405 [Trifolium pratense]